MPVTFTSPFAVGQRVHVDGCPSVAATVTALCWREIVFEAEISWWCEGHLNNAWVAVSRLSSASEAL